MVATSDEWVSIEEAGHVLYCWNRRTQESTHEIVASTWSGQKDAATGSFYYWRRGSNEPPVWLLPAFDPVPCAEQPAAAHGQRAEARSTAAHSAAAPCETAEVDRPEQDPTPFSEPSIVEDLMDSDAWVEVEASARYYWNFKTGTCLDFLPRHENAKWAAYFDQNEGWYYAEISTGQTCWELPCRSTVVPTDDFESLSPWLEIGAPVCLVGLEKQPRFNGQIGVLIDAMPGRCLVRLSEELSSLVLAPQPKNLRCLPYGSLVELFGLQKQDLNGTVGTVHSEQPKARRYVVRFGDGDEKAVRSTNLRPKNQLWNLSGALTPPSGGRNSSTIQWRGEHHCLFVDSQGQHRNYLLHLPPRFDLRQSHSSEKPRWPLIVFLHGTGGGSFFTHSKKAFQADAMQSAAQCFVVVSPRCEWTWRDTPSAWIVELIKALRSLEWLDHERIYLTGLSMGGMGAWEVGAKSPGLFAGICPVAAHHKQERTPWIAHRLHSTPLFVFHDDTDGTCPLSKEMPLWQLLEDNGHRDFKKVISHNIDHCKIFEQAYCSDDGLYRWFLQRKTGAPGFDAPGS